MLNRSPLSRRAKHAGTAWVAVARRDHRAATSRARLAELVRDRSRTLDAMSRRSRYPSAGRRVAQAHSISRAKSRRDVVVFRYPNVNEYASAPGARNVISSVRSLTSPACRTSW
jgi:hypothetical protein